MRRGLPLLSALLLAGTVLSGCKSPHVQVSVENRTGALVRLLEVDYPSASFGADSLAPGAIMRYSVALTGNGPIKLQYIMPNNNQAQATGPQVSEGESGRLEVVLLPGGKANFNPELQTRK